MVRKIWSRTLNTITLTALDIQNEHICSEYIFLKFGHGSPSSENFRVTVKVAASDGRVSLDNV